MLDKLSEVEKRYEEIEHRLYDPWSRTWSSTAS